MTLGRRLQVEPIVMGYQPQFCPNSACTCHKDPMGSFSKRGYYKVKYQGQKVQRYQCGSCKTCFSSRTFKSTYKQHKPYLNSKIFHLLCTGNTLRGTARLLGVNYKTVYRKFIWLSEQIETNKCEQEFKTIFFDEMETIEHTKLKPVSIVLAVSEHYEILGVKVASMPCKGRSAKVSRQKYGPRADDRPIALEELFTDLKKAYGPSSSKIKFVSDSKSAYKPYVERHFGDSTYERVLSRKVEQPDLMANKKRFDPMFALNQRCAKLRADIRRLTRKSWCTTKLIANLQRHLNLYRHYNNVWVLGLKPG